MQIDPRTLETVSKVLAAAARRWAVNLEKAISMGLRSGLQEQKPYAFFFQRLCRLGAFVNRESVEDDHVASLKR